MSLITRNPDILKGRRFDAIIIGGGIYGVMLSLEASRRNLSTLLLEKGDFGEATSFNSLRIVHGGLRYLQSLDLHRFFESVSERKWFLKNFPDLVHPLPCLMPLYGKGLHRNSIFRAALLLNDLLSKNRNDNLPAGSHLENSRVANPQEVKEFFPKVKTERLTGGALWNDASMPDSQRVLIETLKWACSLGGSALNYFEASSLIKKNNKIEGISAIDHSNQKEYHFKSDVIINAAGPWIRDLSSNFDKDHPELFKSSIAWNILIHRKALSSHALAVTPNRPNAKTYFIRPWKGMMFAGTVHQPWRKDDKSPLPSTESIDEFITDLNSCVRGLNIKREEILHIYAGLLPAKEEGSDSIAVREVIIDHSIDNGPKGLYSVSGVKFTTARLVAEKVIAHIFANKNAAKLDRTGRDSTEQFSFDWSPDSLDENLKANFGKIISEESVIHLDDLVLRRTSIGDNPHRAVKLSSELCRLFDWDEERKKTEMKRLINFYDQKAFMHLNLMNQESLLKGN